MVDIALIAAVSGKLGLAGRESYRDWNTGLYIARVEDNFPIDFRCIWYFQQYRVSIGIDRSGVSTISQLSLSGENDIFSIGFIGQCRYFLDIFRIEIDL